ncbi:unnamed protein product [Microthlaspi erraticum]|uniref:RNase H type-1 domain-containing protein n=1 Tax=Microthlaspi erraticum TaxID=1685480 RepID=A0A6D2L6H6_9BRAS|nr:unnamed protein product [Microthlaspi erraticum]
MAEALSIRSALNYALEKGFSKIQLKSDAQYFIRAMSKQEQVKEIYGILFDIHTLASMLETVTFVSIPQSENFVADTIAKIAKNVFVSLISHWDPPAIIIGHV